MATTQKILRVGDIGTQIIVALTDDGEEVDPTNAVLYRFFIARATKSNVLEVTPHVWTDPEDSVIKLRYITQEGDISVKGTYTLQAYIEFANGEWHSSKTTFTVEANVQDEHT